MGRRLRLCALAVAGLVLGNAQPALGQVADTIKKVSAPKAYHLNVPVTPAGPSAQEKAAASALAAALRNAGLTLDSQDLNNLVQGIAEGGPAGMAIAMFLTAEIADANLAQPNPPKRVYSAASLSIAQIDGLIAKLPPDTTLKLTRYLKYKLTQFRKSRSSQ